MTEPLLSVRGLRTVFPTQGGEAAAVKGVDFEVRPGQVLGIVGESGSGKSVTSLSVMRLIRPPGRVASGSIQFEGRDLLALSEKEMREVRGGRIGMIFQDPMSSLNPYMRISEQIMESTRLHLGHSRRAARDHAVEVLKSVGIPGPGVRGDAYPHQLSGGMRQRVMIAMALACKPRLLIADEPIAALDVSIQAQILNLLQELQGRLGLTYLFISHDLRAVHHVADRIAVMYLGKIVELAPASELYRMPLMPYTQALISAVPSPDPDLELQRERIVLQGDIPSPIDPPSGCRFRTRCPQAMPECAQSEPALREILPGHLAACHAVTG